jgi:hypothetical protein
MRAILVCVEYADLLAITLPYNRHHFTEVMVVTTPGDTQTQWVAEACDARILSTDAFYDDGAVFNKFKALEYGLDAMGRHGLLAIMDADILWPKYIGDHSQFKLGWLNTPYRRMMKNPIEYGECLTERDWEKYEIKTETEHAGYSQIFHAEDERLQRIQGPWHETNWRHAGGADSFFQMLWPASLRGRPKWKCLHLGENGKNWCGRSTPYLDGSVPVNAQSRRDQLNEFMAGRKPGGKEKFDHERIFPESV